jgi:hypothetical protein
MTANQFAGWIAVFETGANAGMGQVVASNGTGSIVLESPGIPVAPSAGDDLYLYEPNNRLDSLIGCFYEITNDSFANADADGITAAGGNWNNCLVWQRFICAARAMGAFGYRMIGMTNTDRDEAGRDANYDTDEPLYNARILANTEGVFDEVYDAYTALGANDYPPGGNFCDNVHWANGSSTAGAGKIAAGLKGVLEGMF